MLSRRWEERCSIQSRSLNVQPTHAVIVVVYGDSDRPFDLLRADVGGYWLKGSVPEQVLSALEDMRQGSVSMSANIAHKLVDYFHAQETHLFRYGKTLTTRTSSA